MNIGYSCKKCKQVFKKENYLIKHTNRKIPCDRKIICPRCNKEFAKFASIASHLQRKNLCKISYQDTTTNKLNLQNCNEFKESDESLVKLVQSINQKLSKIELDLAFSKNQFKSRTKNKNWLKNISYFKVTKFRLFFNRSTNNRNNFAQMV